MDVVIRLAAELGQLGIWPCVDPLASRSRLLEDGRVGAHHIETAARVREALAPAKADPVAPGADERMIERAWNVQRFFAQPFFVAEPYTRRPGVSVPLAEALRGCREILDGIHDHLPKEAFYFCGGIEEVRARRP